MQTYHWLFLIAVAAAAVPFFLALLGRDDYNDNEDLSGEHWKTLWSRITRR